MNFITGKGVFAAAAGAFVISFDILLIRLVDANGWDISFWRGTFLFFTVAGIALFQGEWQKFFRSRQVMIWSAVIALVYGLVTILFVLSVTYTKAANTVVIIATGPFFASVFSYYILGELIRLRTGIAIAVCLASVAWVFYGSLGGDGLPGDALAFVVAILLGLALTLLGKFPDLPRLPIVALSGAVIAFFALPLTDPFALEPVSYGWLLLMGCLQIPLASILIMTATRYLPPPEVSLFLLIETILGPTWVWLFLTEAPPDNTLLGGAMIILTITIHSLMSMREHRRTAKSSELSKSVT